jgi:peptidoglycan/LPS O-acetylase OafA/YrhL
MRPEFPFLAAGGIALIGGAKAEGKWPDNWASVLIGTVVLVVVASATAGTKVAPLVRAIGLLLVVTTILAAVKTADTSKKAKKA